MAAAHVVTRPEDARQRLVALTAKFLQSNCINALRHQPSLFSWFSATDELWVCGSSPQWWRKDGQYPPPKDQIFLRFSTDGRVQQLWTVPLGVDGQEKPGQCNWLHCVALDSQGNLYAGDILGRRLQKFIRTDKDK